MNTLKEKLEDLFSIGELQTIASKLDKQYKVSMFWDGWKLIDHELIQYLDIELSTLKTTYHYREIYNFIIMNYGKTEKRIKYFLTKEYIYNDDEVCLYEFNVGNSRLDFGRINGFSYAYEIKTELDNINRLESQINDYTTVFDFINVVVHPKHLSKVRKILPRFVGIIIYNESNDDVIFEVIRNAKKNSKILKTSQLSLLNSNDLKYIISASLENEKVPELKEERYRLVNNKVSKDKFNAIFKETIKYRNQKKWKHIKEHFDVLMPIEIQKVYTNNMDIKYVLF